MAIMRALIVGAVVAGCVAGPAYAQKKGAEKNELQIEEEQKKKDAEVVDRQYRSTLDRLNRNSNTTENRPADPWQNMRGPSNSNSKRQRLKLHVAKAAALLVLFITLVGSGLMLGAEPIAK